METEAPREDHIKRIKAQAPEDKGVKTPHLKSEDPNWQRYQGDLRDSTGGAVRRPVHGRVVSLPITSQATVEGQIDRGVTRRDRGRSLTPIDKLIDQSLGGFQDPHTLKRAQKYLSAKTRGIIKSAQRKSRGIETPPNT
ncbi:MAG: hypothetical protein UU23_C0001G0090 [Candidatus Curtissbacteria bacterium GW2011_GWA1_40_9]|uniref:Uncharacterized protein n=1 Tax=Candidatus Curtissbacteria bacterium GW2011_GWA1_40_9 TaxID=1618408 RepID=A0A0G0TU22_9BACT|nr:MAG: hypothetical protein UU23_C0001G0090 [Candidatus Curtissbacteria bacterium GW2011_GWA1_40_9]